METTYCDKCGKAILPGELATAIASGSIQEDAGGFMPDDDPYIRVLCDKCAEGIGRAIDVMPMTPAQEQGQALLEALAEMEIMVQDRAYSQIVMDRVNCLIARIRAEEKAIEAAKGTREPGANYSTPEPSAEPTVRAVLVVTGNGGGLLDVVPADVPRQVWEDGEAREWAEALALPGPLDSGEGYEIMTAEDARDMAAKLIEAAGKPPPTKGPLIWDGAEGSCPLCGADLDMGAEESTSDGEGIATTNWTCPKCHAAGVQVREAVFQYHRNVEAAPNDPRTVNFTDKAGKPGYYVAGALGEGGGPVLTTPEAARLLRTHGYNLPFDIMAWNYGMDNREEGDEDYIGLSPEDLEEGSLDPDWGPFEVW